MTRHESREQAFILIFERSFTQLPFAEIIETAAEDRELVCSEFTRQLVFGVQEHAPEIDTMIEANLKGWSFSRLSRVAAALLRLAVYELMYEADIPAGVSIDEAVELAKEYGSKDDFSYVNGVLSGVLKQLRGEKPQTAPAKEPETLA